MTPAQSQRAGAGITAPEISVIMAVHDDGPTRQAAQTDPRVVVLRNARCIGLPASLDRALAVARGRFIAWMGAGLRIPCGAKPP